MLDHISLGVTGESLGAAAGSMTPLCSRSALSGPWTFRSEGPDYGAMAGQLGVEFTIAPLRNGRFALARDACVLPRAPNRASVRAFHGAALSAGGHEDGGSRRAPAVSSRLLRGFCRRSGRTPH